MSSPTAILKLQQSDGLVIIQESTGKSKNPRIRLAVAPGALSFEKGNSQMSRTTVEQVCQVCGESFFATPTELRRGQGKTCSTKCAVKLKPQCQPRNRTIVNCQICGKEISLMPCQVKAGGGKYCSYQCGSIGRSKEYKSSTGKYKYIERQGRKTTEHREVGRTILGREFLPGEIIHHINLNREDNRPENLMLFKTSSDHMKFHMGKGDPGTPILELAKMGERNARQAGVDAAFHEWERG